MNSIKGLFAPGSCFSFLGFRWTQRVTAGIIAATLGTSTLTAGPKIDMSRLVVVGDSLSAGYQNMSLLDTQQAKGYAALVAKQANVPMTLPLIAPPGIPNVLVLGPDMFPVQAPGGPSPGREQCLTPSDPCPSPTNLAVPAATLAEILFLTPTSNAGTPAQGFTSLILGLPFSPAGVVQSQVDRAEALHPTALIVWAGSNDVLLPAWLEGSAEHVTPPAVFAQLYQLLMARASATGAAVITANIPDVTSTAAFLTVDKAAAKLQNIPPSVLMSLINVPAGSLIKIDALPVIIQMLQMGGGILDPKYYLDPAEIAAIKGATDAYNQTIEQTAAKFGATIVDVRKLVANLAQTGIVVQGQRLTTEYLGGLYSLDGVHPSDVGYAIIANEFIKTINRNYSISIPSLSLAQVAKTDPLVSPRANRTH